eukprot:COSAG01_NODE_3638_length_5840_cov_4.088312_5_plen_181_part_00
MSHTCGGPNISARAPSPTTARITVEQELRQNTGRRGRCGGGRSPLREVLATDRAGKVHACDVSLGGHGAPAVRPRRGQHGAWQHALQLACWLVLAHCPSRRRSAHCIASPTPATNYMGARVPLCGGTVSGGFAPSPSSAAGLRSRWAAPASPSVGCAAAGRAEVRARRSSRAHPGRRRPR